MATRKPLFINAANYSEEMATTDDVVLGGISSSGDIDLTGGAEVTGLPTTPGGPTAAASKAYVDAVATGLDFKDSSRAATTVAGGDLSATYAPGGGAGGTGQFTGAPGTLDTVVLADGDRVLVKGQTDKKQNGIYEVKTPTTTWDRAGDFDSDAEVNAGAFCFVTEGSAENADTGWVLTSDDPLTLNTSLLEWAQFSGSGSVVGGDGIDVAGNVVSVDLVAAGGLEFATGELQAKLDGTTLAVAAGGLSVAGLPTLFEVGGVATGATVTAANFDELTDGSATTLHTHGAVSEAEKLEATHTVNEAVVIGDPVEWGGLIDRVQKARADTTANLDAIGIAVTAQPTPGSTAEICKAGLATGVVAGATVGDRFYLGSTGGLINGTGGLSAGDWIVFMGTAKNATDLDIRIQVVGQKAA